MQTEAGKWLYWFFGEEILGAAFEDPGQVVEMAEIIVGRIIAAFDLADKTDRHAEFKGKIGLGQTVFDPLFFNPFNNVYINLGFQ